MLTDATIKYITKIAAKERKEVKKYKKDPSKVNKEKLLKALQQAEEDNPVHLQGGYYKDTKSMLDRAEELDERGNKIRGVLTKYVGVPVTAVGETLLSPVRAIGRTISPDTNISFSDLEDLKKESDPEHVTRAANELFKLFAEDRPDPTENWEGMKKLVKSIKATPAEQVADIATHTVTGGVPLLGDAVGDIIATPHTMLFNHMEWNGTPRSEYIKKKKKKKETGDKK